MSKGDLVPNSVNPETETQADGSIINTYTTNIGNDTILTHINHDPNTKVSYVSFKFNGVDKIEDTNTPPSKVARILNTVAGNIKHHFENNEVKLLTHFTYELKKARIYEKMAKLHGIDIINIMRDTKIKTRKNKF